MLAIVLFVIYYIILVHLFAPDKTVEVASLQQPVKPTPQIDRSSMAVIFDAYDNQEKEKVNLTAEYERMTVKQLKRLARERKLKGYSKLRKKELISAILSS